MTHEEAIAACLALDPSFRVFERGLARGCSFSVNGARREILHAVEEQHKGAPPANESAHHRNEAALLDLLHGAHEQLKATQR